MAKNDEDILRKRLVSSIRNQLSNDKELLVEDTHGAFEHGVDIVFLTRDNFGEILCYGIQLKGKKINCTAKNHGVKEIIGQLAIASGHYHKFQTNVRYEFSGFYVITDKEITKPARDYISSAFSVGKPIYYLYGAKLEKFILDNEVVDLTQEE
ncbi:hypothetical protein KO465_03110 [Candidatus Micrarchaeota archaeon]|jgi:hypothetical protein|nr:hypothetical protein [Candidatus Micrarchaeota archaeon]